MTEDYQYQLLFTHSCSSGLSHPAIAIPLDGTSFSLSLYSRISPCPLHLSCNISGNSNASGGDEYDPSGMLKIIILEQFIVASNASAETNHLVLAHLVSVRCVLFLMYFFCCIRGYLHIFHVSLTMNISIIHVNMVSDQTRVLFSSSCAGSSSSRHLASPPVACRLPLQLLVPLCLCFITKADASRLHPVA